VTSEAQIVACFRQGARGAIWVARSPRDLSALIRQPTEPRSRRQLLLLNALPEASRSLLDVYFRHVVALSSATVLLPADELFEVLSSPRRNELFIGGVVDRRERVVVLYRGTVESLVVPLEWFAKRPGGVCPDARGFAVTDFGQTVKLGKYEASADAILYEFDHRYRRARRKQLIEVDESFGSSLRRLRLQKGLKRSDFSGMTEKTIARIERNEIARPRKATLNVIARRLGVAVEELGSF
jgi:hypothetical protein